MKLSTITKQQCLICKKNINVEKGTKNSVSTLSFVPFHKMHMLLEEKKYDSLLPAILTSINYYENGVKKDTLLYLSYYLKGSFYCKNELYKEALVTLLKAQKIGMQFKEPLGWFNLNIDIAISYFEQENYEKALEYYLKLESEAGGFPDNKYLEGGIYNNIARCYANIENHDFKKSEVYYKQSIAIHEELKDSLRIATGYLNLGDLYFEQYRDDEAIRYFKKALVLAQKIKALDIQDDIYFNLALAMESKGNNEKALVYYKAYIEIQEKIWNRDKVWELAEQEKKFIVNKKESEIKLLEKEAKLQKVLLQAKRAERNTFIIVTITLLICLLIGIVAYRQRLKKNKIIARQNIQLDELNRTKDRLFSIVAHDLRSPVYMLKESNVKLQKALVNQNYIDFQKLLESNIRITESTYSMLDNLLYWALEQNKNLFFTIEKLPLHVIVEQVCVNYIESMKLKQIQFIQDIPTHVWIYADLNAFKIVIRNLIDNALKFTKNGGEIKLYTRTKEQLIQLVVEDNGIGISKTVLASIFNVHLEKRQRDTHGKMSTGLGLELCKTMTEKNGGTLDLESEEGIGTRVFITLELAKNENHD
ncbi:tetratricopeptide repeat-containing sensor histidine kinase [Flavobacterium sp. '19STA2R22 D10 B1']|uniref:tetratricopeptide repeat-containing sensor histidine kinase n=1 Tax=Flavobacterium aerium TaxID=3037261 RepID=UPI00278C389F|nr:tetratricopeptide repeat-containing sensor histidine kinase [Flavobacterium sp. '19STA2R22 D10 B1']